MATFVVQVLGLLIPSLVIQNVGVAPAWRGRGLGAALVLQSLHGFARSGLGKALLEVTGGNDAALRLYRRLVDAER